MPADVLEVTKKFMRNPVRILVKKEQLTLEGIKQFYIGVEKEVRKLALDIPNIYNILYGIIWPVFEPLYLLNAVRTVSECAYVLVFHVLF